MNSAVQTTTTPTLSSLLPKMGTPMPGGVLVAIMPSIDDHPAYYLIAPADPAVIPDEFEWGGDGDEVEGLSSWDGKKNTELLLADSNEHLPALKCKALSIDGCDDFYLASRREAAAISASFPDHFGDDWYWTSSQYSANYAYVQSFRHGSQGYDRKDSSYRVLAVRRIIID